MKKLLLTLLLFVSISKVFPQVPDSVQVDTSYIAYEPSSDVDIRVYDLAMDWIGSKYRVGGNSKNGVDCSGLAKILYQDLYQYNLPRTAREQYTITQRVKKEDLQPGDLVFFRVRSRTTWHVGVYLSDGLFVHAANRRSGVITSNLDDHYYSRTFVSGGRIKQSKEILNNQFSDYINWIKTHEQQH
jgi:lipoprotein Spr